MTESEFQELEARAAKLVEALHASSFVEEIGAVVPFCGICMAYAWHMTPLKDSAVHMTGILLKRVHGAHVHVWGI